MSASLSRDRLAAVLAMMGSVHDGECLAAARTAERLRQQAGITWGDLLLEAPAQESPSPPPDSRPDLFEWRNLVRWCLARPRYLTKWEQEFLQSLSWRRKISPKQATILHGIADKAETTRR